MYTQLPVEVSQLRPIAQEYHAKVKQFIQDHILPVERQIAEHGASENKWEIPPIIEELKVCTSNHGSAQG